MINKKELWERCAAFHGHVCGGLTIGYQAALYAAKLLGLTFSQDEEVVCICENDACGVDAHPGDAGMQRREGESFVPSARKTGIFLLQPKNGRICSSGFKGTSGWNEPGGIVCVSSGHQPEELFDVKKTVIALPEAARMFRSVKCECCGEITAENMIRLENGKSVCLDCCHAYNRFDVS